MDIVVSAGGQLTCATLGSYFRKTDSEGPCVIDLACARFVDPSGIVAIAAVAERARSEGREVDLRPPLDSNCRNYLARMQVGAQLTQLGVEHQLASVHSHAVGDRLQELRRFDHEAGIEKEAGAIVRLLARGDATITQPLYQALFEIGVNVVQHSGKGGGFVALQVYRNARHVAFAIADCGRGLRDALCQTMPVPGDVAAMRLAAQKHVSSTGIGGRGRGITGVIEVVGRHRGDVTMISGVAQGEFTNGHWDPRVTTLQTPFLGTLAQARFALEGRLDL